MDASIALGNHPARLRRHAMDAKFRSVDEFLGDNAREDTASLLRDSIGIPPNVKMGRYVVDHSLDSKTFAIVCAIYLLEQGV